MSTWPGLAAVDTASLSVSGRSLQGERIKSVGYGPDGSTLYALSQAGNLLLIDARTMTKVSEIALASPGEAILHIS